MTATPTSEPTGVIHDIGYRHYDGPRLGRRPVVAALTLHSLRAVFGLGRPARFKIMPVVLTTTMMFPAVVSIVIMAAAKQPGLPYPQFTIFMQAVLAIFLASQAPVLVAPDLRHKVLPLYFSRPVPVQDYVTAKLAAMIAALFLLIATPLTVTYLGELLIDLPGPPHTGEFLGSLVTGLIYAVLLGSVGVAIAALSPRRGIGVAAVIALYLFSSAVSGMLYGLLTVNGSEAAPWAHLLNPFHLVGAVQHWLFGQDPGVPYPDGASGPVAAFGVLVLIAVSVGVLLLRYRKAATS